jgi:serpin B
VRQVDFEGAPEDARLTINKAISDETQGNIKDLLPMGAVDPTTRLVLTNAIYFHADWAAPFNPKSSTGTFNAPSGPVSVPMMSADLFVPRWSGAGYQAVALPYSGGTTSMIIVVPDAGTFDAFEHALTPDALLSTLAGAPAPTQTRVFLPRFTVTTKLRLGKTLQGLGMTDAFRHGTADFSGIDGARDLEIADVIHQARVAVDEQGTVAAAATAVVTADGGATFIIPEVRVDRPFLFAIRDDATGTILFLGRVVDPTGGGGSSTPDAAVTLDGPDAAAPTDAQDSRDDGATSCPLSCGPSQYCRHTVDSDGGCDTPSSVGAWACFDLPASCNGTPSCACLATSCTCCVEPGDGTIGCHGV